MTAKHTPGPWVEHPEQKGRIYSTTAKNEGGERVCVANIHGPSGEWTNVHQEHEANAEFIVRACNSHDALLDVCGAMLDRLKTNNGELELGPVQQRGWAKLFQSAISAGESERDEKEKTGSI